MGSDVLVRRGSAIPIFVDLGDLSPGRGRPGDLGGKFPSERGAPHTLVAVAPSATLAIPFALVSRSYRATLCSESSGTGRKVQES
jgi:hypothetical protein